MSRKRKLEEKIKRYEEKLRKLQQKPITLLDVEKHADDTHTQNETIIECYDDEHVEPTCDASDVTPDTEPVPSTSSLPVTESIQISTSEGDVPILSPELLSALGDPVTEIIDFGEDIHPNLAERWVPILLKGLTKESREKLLIDYKIPANCKLLMSPKINPEIQIVITESLKLRDKKLESTQQQLGHGITALNKAMTTLLTSDDKCQAIKTLSDACRILTDLHFLQTEHRLKLITPSLDKSFLTIIEKENRDETLLGNGLSEKIKTAKAIEKQGMQIKKNVPVLTTPKPSTSTSRNRGSGNWSGPPHFPVNRRGTMRGGQRPTYMPSQVRRAPTTTTRGPTPLPPPSTGVNSQGRYYQHRVQRRN